MLDRQSCLVYINKGCDYTTYNKQSFTLTLQRRLVGVNIFYKEYLIISLCVNCSGFLFVRNPLFICFNLEDKTINDYFINEQIRDKEVRVIGEDGEQLGVMSAAEAQAKADEAGLDLIKIAPTAVPPVCKIADFGKFRYEMARREKDQKKKQKVTEIKEIRLSPNIDTNDLNTKMSAAKKFLSKGDKVKVTLRFRGREMAHMQESKHILDDFAEGLADVATVEKAPKVEGRSMTMFLTEKK